MPRWELPTPVPSRLRTWARIGGGGRWGAVWRAPHLDFQSQPCNQDYSDLGEARWVPSGQDEPAPG